MSTVNDVKKQVATTGIVTVFDFFEKNKDIITKSLPNSITPDRLIGVFTMLLRSSPELMQCSQSSLIASVIQCVQLGLQPGNVNHVYLIPFNNKQKDGSYKKEVQLIVSVRGMTEMVNRCGKAVVLCASVVKEKDFFEYELGLNPSLRHIPSKGERGNVIGVYAVAKNLVANEKVFVYLNRDEIEKVKSSSKAGQSQYSPWNTWFEAMCEKTAVKRLCKLLPLSVDTQREINADETIKTKIDEKMVEVPDETEWEDAEISEPKAEQAPAPAPAAAPASTPAATPEAAAPTPAPEPPAEPPPSKSKECSQCGAAITNAEYGYSKDKFGRPLCRVHQAEAKK